MKLLHQSIQIMTRFARETGHRTSLIIDFGLNSKKFNELSEKDLTLLNALFYMTIIDAYSYLQEYEQVFGTKTESEFKERVIEVKTINKPLTNKIKEWKDLGDFRNQLLAHNLRKGKNGEFIFAIKNLDYNAPKTINELFLLSNLLQFITQTIHLEFKSELDTISDNASINYTPNSRTLTKEDVSSITSSLLVLATAEIKRLNKKYKFEFKASEDWDKL